MTNHEDHFGGIDDLVDAGVPVLESYDRWFGVGRPPSRLFGPRRVAVVDAP